MKFSGLWCNVHVKKNHSLSWDYGSKPWVKTQQFVESIPVTYVAVVNNGTSIIELISVVA